MYVTCTADVFVCLINKKCIKETVVSVFKNNHCGAIKFRRATARLDLSISITRKCF